MKRNALLSGKSLQKAAVYIAFVVFFVVFSVSLRNVGSGFLDLGNLMNILRQTALIAIIAVGMTFALGAAQIDLSVGPIVAVTSLVTSMMLRQYGIFPAVVAGLMVGVVIGAINGFLTSALKVPAFLATLGTQIIFAGVARTITNLKSVPIMDSSYKYFFGGGDIGFFPILGIWMIVFVALGYVVMQKTGFGRRVVAVGSNPTASFYSGVSVKRTIFSVMLMSGVLASLAGILWAGRFGGGRYSLGEGEELSVIAATVLGGTSIYGGRATVLGAAVGAIMIGMINNALILYGLDVYQQMIIRGIIIIAAVALTTSRD